MRTTATFIVALTLAMAAPSGSTPAMAADTQALPAGTTAFSPGKRYDKMSWEAFITAVTPATSGVEFETWASDLDTYPASPASPAWPSGGTGDAGRFQGSLLQAAHAHSSLRDVAIDGGCVEPGDASAGNFPTPAKTSPPGNCIAEEVRRNKPSFDYIVNNELNTQAGLVKNFATTSPISFPSEAIELKADWVPVDTLKTWLTNNGKTPWKSGGFKTWVKSNYYVTKSESTEYALLSMHISTKQFPNWLWATFEHELNPGRCDTMGCYDEYGMKTNASILPVTTPATGADQNFYPVCTKSAALTTLFTNAGLANIWDHYCLKASQVNFVSHQQATAGLALLNGDSVVERIAADVPIKNSSCITCHAYASFDAKGCVNANGLNPGLRSDGPVGLVEWEYFTYGQQKMYDFAWGVFNLTNTQKNCN